MPTSSNADRADYHRARDFPAVKGPSYLGVHLRFGTVSIRELAARGPCAGNAGGDAGAATWLSELIWRDFYFQVLANFPHVADAEWHAATASSPPTTPSSGNRAHAAQALFAAWCEGRTGYPLVDAAMAQINQTGYMHNRLRMVVASFLTKDLGIDWRWGERYFAQQLNDYDLAANNGGWQWAASSGCDAQPYFRIFNPVSQSRKFDPEGKFIRRYLPQLAGCPHRALHEPWTAGALELAAAGVELGRTYPARSCSHDEARERTLRRYAVVRRTAAVIRPAHGGGAVVLDQAEQLFFGIRLAQVVVDAEFLGVFAVLLGDARGDHDDRQVLQPRVAADVARQVEAVHARHLDVRQHHRRLFLGQPLQGLQAVGRQRHPIAFALQQALRHAAHGDGIVHHQDQRNLRRRRCRGQPAGPRRRAPAPRAGPGRR